MKIASIHLQNFKRFTDLTIEGIPPAAKLVILLGPNGCGKSSVFDAMHVKSYQYAHIGKKIEPEYYLKIPSQIQTSEIEFHDSPKTNMDRAIYTRTAYRNDPVMNVGGDTSNAIGSQREAFQQHDSKRCGCYQQLSEISF